MIKNMQTLTTTYYQAGYFLVAARPYTWAEGETQFLPTVSTCINATFPDTWALSWCQTSDAEREQLARDYGISGTRLEAIQAWGDASLTSLTPGPFGWPNVLTSLEAARGFYREFLSHLSLRLLGLSVPEDQLELALATLKPRHPQEGICGLYWMLSQRLPETTAGEMLGYEIMGLETGGSLHSFYCNALQADYRRLGCEINQQGLLSHEADVHKALEWTLAEETHAEPVPWLSFRVREFPC